MEVEEIKLPGIGLRHDFTTAAGRRVGVISLKSGARHLAIYCADDPDTVLASVELSNEEAQVLSELLGMPRVVERLAKLREQVEGITTAGVPLTGDSPYVGRTLGDAQIRSRTGASVVAVFRNDEVAASPAPDFRFRVGDRVVIVGTEEGVKAATAVLEPNA
ncbi:cation:proton antiporter regulatory subunit [Nocardioides sp.]|uniref:cation:proton antiporter regulatory subunit n=1 Tax=Nocardioides sp. TaxID=35761 RepID=UPI0039E3C3FF